MQKKAAALDAVHLICVIWKVVPFVRRRTISPISYQQILVLVFIWAPDICFYFTIIFLS